MSKHLRRKLVWLSPLFILGLATVHHGAAAAAARPKRSGDDAGWSAAAPTAEDGSYAKKQSKPKKKKKKKKAPPTSAYQDQCPVYSSDQQCETWTTCDNNGQLWEKSRCCTPLQVDCDTVIVFCDASSVVPLPQSCQPGS